MTLKISYINEISPLALEFDDGIDTEKVVHPKAAFEVIGTFDGERLETYGLIWTIDGQDHAFISEELENLILKKYSAKFTKEKQEALNYLIMCKHKKLDLALPFTLFS